MDADLLPPRAAELANVIGLHDALKVCEVLGGQYKYVPLEYSAHPLLVTLTHAIGEEQALKVMAHYAGSFLELPKCQRWFQIKIRNVILVQGGRKVDELAVQANLTRRRVFQIRRDHKQNDERMQDLFD